MGGAERHVVDLSLALARRGHAVTVASASGGPLERCLGGSGVTVAPLLGYRVKRSISIAYARALRGFLARRRFDLVHAHVYASQAAAALALTGLDVPMVMTEHSEGTWQGWKERRMVRRHAARARRVVGVSEGICRRLARLGVDPARIACIPNAVPAAMSHATGGERVVRTRSVRVVGVVGRLCPEKGHATFLEAVARVGAADGSARFVIVGGGESLASLQARARALGVADRVDFLGARDDARDLIAALDLLVVPSLSEGSPLVVLEALSAGVPVLASRVGGIPQQIQHGLNGLLVPPGDPAALAAELARILDNSYLLDRLWAGAHEYAAADRYESVLDQLERVYDDAQSGSVAAGSKGSYSFSAAV